jgi:glutamine synthetase
VNNGHRGYLEDRRPNSLGDPYRIAGRILQTISAVPTSDFVPSEQVLEEAAA